MTVVQPGDTVDAAVDRADAAMYHGKRTAPGRSASDDQAGTVATIYLRFRIRVTGPAKEVP